ncbi:MAG: pyrroline-5-carboxylate reductase [Elusimicrobia bacterium]|nr:pyrroline-5-carboxylate reductase [Elusimicrobiota bacterium]
MTTNITFIGAGNMAEAIIASMSDMSNYCQIVCHDISAERLAYIQGKFSNIFDDTLGVTTEIDLSKAVAGADIVVLAVKPQIMAEALESLRPILQKDILVISIAAGLTTQYFENALPHARIIRAMPNTPLMVAKGATAICKGASATNNDLEKAKEIFSTAGIVEVVDESKMDITTVLSGSGPAYIFYFCELLIKAAAELGLDKETARTLAVQTIRGAGAMLETCESAQELRAKVTSKGGATEAAIKSFEAANFEGMVKEALTKAAQRAKELNK